MVHPMHQQHHSNHNQFSRQSINRVNNNALQRPTNRLIRSNSPISTLAYKGFGDISKTLTNVDQVVKVLRSATPIVQEYAPMIRNLPAMYRMVKALGQTSDENTARPNDNDINESETKSQYTQGESRPKLFI